MIKINQISNLWNKLIGKPTTLDEYVAQLRKNNVSEVRIETDSDLYSREVCDVHFGVIYSRRVFAKAERVKPFLICQEDYRGGVIYDGDSNKKGPIHRGLARSEFDSERKAIDFAYKLYQRGIKTTSINSRAPEVVVSDLEDNAKFCYDSNKLSSDMVAILEKHSKQVAEMS
ncbi:hypothetical protein HZA97_02760 [Candidatus Woesearchaeota archaeon]|nr:hypothetical protein [Candidatus Woesearchaeota archaeon]